MKKDRKDILRELREEVIAAKDLGAGIDIAQVIEDHREDVVDSIELDEMANIWIYSRVAPEANSRDMYSVGGKVYMDRTQASEAQLIIMIANQLEKKQNAQKTLEKMFDPEVITFNYELGKVETRAEKITRLMNAAYKELDERERKRKAV